MSHGRPPLEEWPPPPTVRKVKAPPCEDPRARLMRAAFSAVTIWGSCLGGKQSTRKEKRDQGWKEGGSQAAIADSVKLQGHLQI